MGAASGGAGIGAGLGALLGPALLFATGGAAPPALPAILAAGGLGAAAGGAMGYSTQKSSQDATNSAHAMSDLQNKQDADAKALEQKMLQQPKEVPDDNFLATKNKTLQNMRLGIGSTMTGASSSASPTLSSTSLTGKAKLGA